MPAFLTLPLSDSTAVTAIEYALIAGFVAIAAVALIQGLGSSLSGMFGSVSVGL